MLTKAASFPGKGRRFLEEKTSLPHKGGREVGFFGKRGEKPQPSARAK